MIDKLASKGAALQRGCKAEDENNTNSHQPMVTYAFTVAPYWAMDIKRLDSMIAQMAEEAYRQRRVLLQP
jgi:hypothetical protein